MPGEVIGGKYRLERRLAEGGMGVVFSATHVELEHRVAIKFIRPELTGKEDVVVRFLNEARASAQLASHHIARVIDAGRTGAGFPYLVMDYLLGEDLGTVLQQRGVLAPHEAAAYVLQTCEALAVAHAAGIVHRDIKPENLFVTVDGSDTPCVKVLDFGISKHLAGDPTGSLTRPGTSLGSPEYMSPEQMTDRGVDTRADIWALGVVLFELLTGQRPFEGQSMAEICAAVLRDGAPLPSRKRPDLNPAFDAIVSRCLKKDPSDRYGSVAELARDLEPFMHAEPSPSQRTAAALGLAPSPQEGPRNRSEGVLHPVVIASAPERRRSGPKRLVWSLAAVSSILLTAGLASSTQVGSRLWASSPGLGLGDLVRPLGPGVKHLTDGWLTPPPLGPDVPVDEIVPDRTLGTDPEPPTGARNEALAEREPGPSPAILVSSSGAAAPGGLRRAQRPRRAEEVSQRYHQWLREEGLTPLREVEAPTGAGRPGPVKPDAALVATATPNPPEALELDTSARSAPESAVVP
jgi:eukaryotic-like serine/threonine-protein kinase